MNKSKILKAINEGLKSSLIDFGNDKILKSSKVNNGCVFKKGDYVYYDDAIGYNNKYGDKVAICVNDDINIDNLLFVVLNHLLYSLYNKYSKHYKWAMSTSDLDKSAIPISTSGYENTQYILNNYDTWNTLWSVLKPLEYIPSIEELLILYSNMCNNKNLYDTVNLSIIKNNNYLVPVWSSTLSDIKNMANYIILSDGCIGATFKTYDDLSPLVFIKIDSNMI